MSEEIKSPLKAIRAYCLNCGDGTANEVKNCVIQNCPLYAFRFGKNPYHKLNLTDEQRKARSETMRRVRATQNNAPNDAAEQAEG